MHMLFHFVSAADRAAVWRCLENLLMWCRIRFPSSTCRGQCVLLQSSGPTLTHCLTLGTMAPSVAGVSADLPGDDDARPGHRDVGQLDSCRQFSRSLRQQFRSSAAASAAKTSAVLGADSLYSLLADLVATGPSAVDQRISGDRRPAIFYFVVGLLDEGLWDRAGVSNLRRDPLSNAVFEKCREQGARVFVVDQIASLDRHRVAPPSPMSADSSVMRLIPGEYCLSCPEGCAPLSFLDAVLDVGTCISRTHSLDATLYGHACLLHVDVLAEGDEPAALLPSVLHASGEPAGFVPVSGLRSSWFDCEAARFVYGSFISSQVPDWFRPHAAAVLDGIRALLLWVNPRVFCLMFVWPEAVLAVQAAMTGPCLSFRENDRQPDRSAKFRRAFEAMERCQSQTPWDGSLSTASPTAAAAAVAPAAPTVNQKRPLAVSFDGPLPVPLATASSRWQSISAQQTKAALPAGRKRIVPSAAAAAGGGPQPESSLLDFMRSYYQEWIVGVSVAPSWLYHDRLSLEADRGTIVAVIEEHLLLTVVQFLEKYAADSNEGDVVTGEQLSCASAASSSAVGRTGGDSVVERVRMRHREALLQAILRMHVLHMRTVLGGGTPAARMHPSKKRLKEIVEFLTCWKEMNAFSPQMKAEFEMGILSRYMPTIPHVLRSVLGRLGLLEIHWSCSIEDVAATVDADSAVAASVPAPWISAATAPAAKPTAETAATSAVAGFDRIMQAVMIGAAHKQERRDAFAPDIQDDRPGNRLVSKTADAIKSFGKRSRFVGGGGPTFKLSLPRSSRLHAPPSESIGLLEECDDDSLKRPHAPSSVAPDFRNPEPQSYVRQRPTGSVPPDVAESRYEIVGQVSHNDACSAYDAAQWWASFLARGEGSSSPSSLPHLPASPPPFPQAAMHPLDPPQSSLLSAESVVSRSSPATAAGRTSHFVFASPIRFEHISAHSAGSLSEANISAEVAVTETPLRAVPKMRRLG